MNQLSFSSSLYILPSQSQLVVTSSLTLLSGRQQMNRQHHPGGRATSGGDRGPFFPLSFPSFESPKSPCNSPFLILALPPFWISKISISLMNLVTISKISKTATKKWLRRACYVSPSFFLIFEPAVIIHFQREFQVCETERNSTVYHWPHLFLPADSGRASVTGSHITLRNISGFHLHQSLEICPK